MENPQKAGQRRLESVGGSLQGRHASLVLGGSLDLRTTDSWAYNLACNWGVLCKAS